MLLCIKYCVVWSVCLSEAFTMCYQYGCTYSLDRWHKKYSVSKQGYWCLCTACGTAARCSTKFTVLILSLKLMCFHFRAPVTRMFCWTFSASSLTCSLWVRYWALGQCLQAKGRQRFDQGREFRSVYTQPGICSVNKIWIAPIGTQSLLPCPENWIFALSYKKKKRQKISIDFSSK